MLVLLLCSTVNSSFAANYLWVANYGSNDVSKVDTVNNSIVDTIAVGEGPYGVAVSAAKVFVANRVSKSITVIDKFTDKVITNVPLDRHPSALAIGPDNYLHAIVTDTLVGYTSSNTAYLYKIDIEHHSMVKSLKIRTVSNLDIGIGINKQNVAYIPWEYSWSTQTGITIVDLNSYTIRGTYQHSNSNGYLGPGIAVDSDGNGWVTGRRSSSQSTIIKVTPSGGSTFYKGNSIGSRYELVIDEQGFVWSAGYVYTLVRINPANGEITTFTLPDWSSHGDSPAGLSYSDGYLWLVDPNLSVVRKVDPADGQEVERIPVGSNPRSIGDLSGFEARPYSCYDQTSINYFAAPGTVFTKSADQQFGDLFIDDGERGSKVETTTIGSVGQHTIADVALVDGTNDQYRVTVAQDDVTGWPEPGERPDQTGLKGLLVSLDGNQDSTLYEILDNTSHSIIVQSSDDLSGYVGNSLMGVIRLNGLTLSENGNLVTADVLYADTYNVPNQEKLAGIPNVFLQDKVVSGHLEIDSQVYNSLQADSLSVTDGNVYIVNDLHVVNGNMLITGNGHLQVGGTITVQGNLLVDGSQQMVADSIIVEGDLILTAANLELNIADKLSVAGNVLLSSDSVVTVPAADAVENTIYPLVMAVQGTLTIDDTSVIDLTAKGYPAGYTIGFGDTAEDTGGSYGGMGGGNGFDGTYGDFRHAVLAGGGGYRGAGGGLLKLDANTIDLQGNGAILANGEANDFQSGAGGGIDITTGNLKGTGRILAMGGETTTASAASGSGGRISITCQDMLLPESQVSVRGGERINGNENEGLVGGAGTVYLEKTGETGRLVADNGTTGKTTQWSPLHSVGFHQIVTSQVQAGDRLYIEVTGTPWTSPAESPDGIGLVGLYVDLQADTYTGPQYRVIDNGSNWLILDTSDLPAGESPVIGESLIGVVNLQSLKIAGGARLKTSDRVVLADANAVEGTVDSAITFGQWENWYNKTWPQGLELVFNGDQTVPSMNLSGGILFISGSLTANGAVTLSSSQFNVQGDVVTGNDLTLMDSQGTAGGDVNVQGTGMLISSASNITVNGGISVNNAMSLTFSQVTLQGSVSVAGSLSQNDSQVTVQGSITAGEIIGLSNSSTTALGTLTVNNGVSLAASQLNVTGNTVIDGMVGFSLASSQATLQGSTTLAGGLSLADSQFTAGGVVSVNGDAGMIMVGSDFIVKNAVNVTTDVILRENSEGVGSKITVPDAVAGSATIYSLYMDIGGALTVSRSSSIDMTGKGYPADRTIGFVDTTNSDGGSHGAMGGGHTSNLTFGDFHKANFAGSGGYSSAGGGLIRLKAGNINLEDNGAIFANGKSSSNYTGAGGGIHIETGGLTGTGVIQARGGTTISTSSSTYSGSGGRISIYYLAMSLPENNITARGGERTTASLNQEMVGGAGTIFLKRIGESGRLLVDNNAAGKTTMWTPLRSVGQHQIESSQLLAADMMQINVVGTPWQTPAASLDKLGLVGLQVDLHADDFGGPFYEIVDNGTNWITIQGQSLDQLDLGGASLIGVVVLDSLEIYNGAAFTTRDRLVLNNTFNLDEYAMIEFGQLEGWENYNYPQGTKLHIYGDTVVQSLTITEMEATVNGSLKVNGSLALQGIDGSNTSLFVDSIQVTGNLILEKALLNCPDVTVGDGSPGGGAIYLLDGAIWSVPDATATVVYPLSITATGKLTIADNAVININGKGYLNAYVGPDGSYQPSDYNRLASHGGLSSHATADGSYGCYKKVMRPGSGGKDGRGGGFASIKVGSLYLAQQGSIMANGNNANGAGAGGGLHFEIGDQFEGSGTISVRGGNSSTSTNQASYHSGAGGRISVDVSSAGDKFVGMLDAGGGSYNTSKVAGAGTIYFGPEEFNENDPVHLIVSNLGRVANTGSTPIRKVGRFTVYNAEPAGTNAWKVFTETTHWQQYDQDLQWGIVGNYIDLDPATPEGPFFKIIDNGPDNFTIADPNGVISSINYLIEREFIGIHRFSTLQVTGGASVDFGGDRVIVSDTANSVWDLNSEIIADGDSVLPVQQ
jgi:YVTN family beta-propeller protein